MLCWKSSVCPKSLYDNVVADLVSQTKSIKQGNGLADETTMGPLVSAQQQNE